MSTATVDAATLRAKVEVQGAEKGRSDLHSVGAAADKAKSQLSGLGSGFSLLKTAFTAGLGAVAGTLTGFLGFGVVTNILGGIKDGIFNLVQAGISGNASMEQLQIGFTTMLGSGQKAMTFLKQLRDFANVTPFEFPELAQDAQQLLAMGFAAKQVIPMMTAIGDATAALGGGPDVLNRIVLALGQMHARGKADAQDMMQLTEAGVPAWDLLAKGIGRTTQQTMDLVSRGMIPAGKAVDIITAGMEKRFGGLMQKQSTTFNGLISTIQDFAQTAINKTLEPVFKLAEQGVEALATAVESPQFQDFIDNVAIVINALMTNLADTIQHQVIPAVQALLDSPVAKAVQSWADGFLHTLAPALDDKTGVAQSANAATTALGDKGLTGAGGKASKSLGGVGGASKQAGTDVDGFVTHVNKGITQVLGLATAIDGPDSPSAPHLTPAMKRATKQFDDLDAAQKKQATTSQNQSIPVISGIGDLFGRAGEKVGEFVDGIKKRFPAAEDQIQRIGNFLGGVFGPDGALPGLQTMWDGFWGALSFPVRVAFDFVTGLVNAGLDLLGGNFTQFEQDTSKTFQTVLGDIEDFGASIGRFLIGPFEAGLGGIIGAVRHFPDLFAPEFTKAWQSLGISTGRAIIAWGESALQQLEIWANKVIDAYNNTVGNLPGFSKLQEGEVIQLPSGGGRTPGTGKRARGGPTSGFFEGAEEGPELLVKHGIYYAPPGSYVYNAQQTRQILSGSGNRRGGGGDTYITVNGADATSAAQIASHVHRELRRRDLLTGMGVA